MRWNIPEKSKILKGRFWRLCLHSTGDVDNAYRAIMPRNQKNNFLSISNEYFNARFFDVSRKHNRRVRYFFSPVTGNIKDLIWKKASSDFNFSHLKKPH